MTVQSVEMFTVMCDRCGADACEGGEFVAWQRAGTAIDVAVDSGWLATDDGKHFCDDCTMWDEDSDMRVPRPPVVTA